MKLGRQQKAAAIEAARNFITQPTLKRIGEKWAAIGYASDRPLAESNLWGGVLFTRVSMDEAPARAGEVVYRVGDWRVHCVWCDGRIRRDVVQQLQTIEAVRR